MVRVLTYEHGARRGAASDVGWVCREYRAGGESARRGCLPDGEGCRSGEEPSSNGLSVDAEDNEAKSGVWRLSAVAELIWNVR